MKSIKATQSHSVGTQRSERCTQFSVLTFFYVFNEMAVRQILKNEKNLLC